jgi:hypothetical protein
VAVAVFVGVAVGVAGVAVFVGVAVGVAVAVAVFVAVAVGVAGVAVPVGVTVGSTPTSPSNTRAKGCGPLGTLWPLTLTVQTPAAAD